MVKTKTSPTLEHIVTNITIDGTNVRYDTLEGREYFVAPIAMLTHGVHAGSGGPIYYGDDELGKAPGVWNMKPIVVYHPQINGKGISACSKSVIDNSRIGLIMNSGFDEKLRCEGWFDMEKTKTVDQRVYTALQERQMMEVSTGMFMDVRNESGEHDGEEYDRIAMNLKPDHLAILPDQIGACSIADGGGLFQLNSAATGNSELGRTIQSYLLGDATQKSVLEVIKNARSHSSISSALRQALKEILPDDDSYVWIQDVFDDGTFVYEYKDRLFKLNYSASDTTTAVSGQPVPVALETRYVEIEIDNGDVVIDNNSTPNEDTDMTKAEKITLIINSDQNGFTTDDQEKLEGFDEVILDKIPAEAESGGGNGEGGESTEPAPATNSNVLTATPTTQPAATTNSQQPAEPVTVDQYISNAPPEMQDMLRAGITAHEQQKTELIETIVANANNRFQKTWLQSRTLEELQGLAAIAATPGQQQNNGSSVLTGGTGNPVDYSGAGGIHNAAPGTVLDDEDDALVPLTMNYEKIAEPAA